MLRAKLKAKCEPRASHIHSTAGRQSETQIDRVREREREVWRQSDCLVSFAVLAGSCLPACLSACVCECVQVSVSCSDDIALLWSAATWGPGPGQPTDGHKAASVAQVAVESAAAAAGVATCLSM